MKKNVLVYNDDLTKIDIIEKKGNKIDLFNKDFEEYDNYIVLSEELEEKLILSVVENLILRKRNINKNKDNSKDKAKEIYNYCKDVLAEGVYIKKDIEKDIIKKIGEVIR